MRECVSSDPVDDVDDTVAGGDVTGEEGGTLRGLPVAVSEGELHGREIMHSSHTPLLTGPQPHSPPPTSPYISTSKLQATPFTLHYKPHPSLYTTSYKPHPLLYTTSHTLHSTSQDKSRTLHSTPQATSHTLYSTSQATGHGGLASNAFIVHHKHSAVR